jgi:hypothetical protein
MDLSSDDFTRVDPLPSKPKRNPPPEPEPPKCSIADAVQELLSNEGCEEGMAWLRSSSYKGFLADMRPMDNAKTTASHLIHCWKTSCASRAKWGHIEIPTLSSDPITVGQLHAYLSEILSAHPDFATIPVHHEECCGNVETGWVKFLVDEGILVLS